MSYQENKRSTSYDKCVTLGSLFDGSGGFPLAGVLHGAVPLWASEIEPYPIAVTRSRFPNMKHLGSVTEINGGEIDSVDIITFGSPCQDMSVAGRRAGMQHSSKGDEDTTRSGLFYEAVRIIREMREKTNGEYPKYAIWENVPGAYTSNNGEDFLCVLEELYAFCSDEEEFSIPRPANGKWASSGEIVGNRGSIAWRTLDAQYWGVPQRRKRIYLVADFDSDRAGAVLFERDCLLGNSKESRETRETVAQDAGGCAERSCISFAWANSAGAGLSDSKDVTPTVKAARCGEPAIAACIGCFNPWDSQSERIYEPDGIHPCLSANASGGQNRSGVVYSIDPLSSNSMKSSNPNSGFHETQCAKCLDTNGCNPTCNQGGNVVVAAFMGGQGAKAGGIAYSERVSPTIKSTMSGSNTTPDVVYEATIYEPASAMDENWRESKVKNALRANASKSSHAVVYDTTQITSPANYSNPKLDDPCHPLAAQQHPPLAVVCSVDCRNMKINEELSGTLQAKGNGGYSLNYQNPVCIAVDGYNQSASDVSGTLRTGSDCDHVKLVCYIPASFAGYEECKPTLRASGGDAGGGSEGIICMPCCPQYSGEIDVAQEPKLASGKNTTGTLLACASTKMWLGNQEAFTGDYTIVHGAVPPRKYIVRRLIPIECARLQGFPDCWGFPNQKLEFTEEEKSFWHEVRSVYAAANGKKYKQCKDDALLKWYNKLHTDSAEYKMWGNGIALPCAEYVVGGVVEAIVQNRTE